jgi:hypothetical protein
MDQKQMIMQRANELIENHLDEVLRRALHQVEHDQHVSPLRTSAGSRMCGMVGLPKVHCEKRFHRPKRRLL